MVQAYSNTPECNRASESTGTCAVPEDETDFKYSVKVAPTIKMLRVSIQTAHRLGTGRLDMME